MAKLREIPCIYYISMGECKKGRDASHKGYCQKCGKYYPRACLKNHCINLHAPFCGLKWANSVYVGPLRLPKLPIPSHKL